MNLEKIDYSEKRSYQRVELPVPLPASAIFGSITIEGELIDISDGGAKFRVSFTELGSAYQEGTLINWKLSLPSGASEILACTLCWISRFPEGFIMGVKFLDTNQRLLKIS